MSQKMQTRPSNLFEITDPLASYCFDRAVWIFGTSVEADLQEIDANASDATFAVSRKRLCLSRWLDTSPASAFASPLVG